MPFVDDGLNGPNQNNPLALPFVDRNEYNLVTRLVNAFLPVTPLELQAHPHLALRHGDRAPLAVGVRQGAALRTLGASVLLVGQHTLQSVPRNHKIFVH